MPIAGTFLLSAVAVGVISGCSSNSSGASHVAALPPATPHGGTGYAFTSDVGVRNILAGSCFDCHSEESTASWYVKMAPSYWSLGSAMKDLNFSNWNGYDAKQKSEAITAIGRVVTRGQMPPWDYTVFHPAAELSNQQKDIVNSWAMKETSPLSAH